MRRLVSNLLLLWVWLHGSLTVAQEHTDSELGRSIYETGIGRDGREIGATVHGSVALTGIAVACIGCHGRDGRGGGEAFVRAPDIRWFSLSKPYPGRRAGVAGAPYDAAHFAIALRSGVSSEGKRLDPAMPRFDLADDEVQSLVAYLGALGEAPRDEPPRHAVLGLLPLPGRSDAADGLAAGLRHCPDRTRGAPVAAVDILYFQNPEDAIAQLDARIQRNPHTLILSPYLLGWEMEYVKESARWKVPTVLPFAFLDPPSESAWYYRFPGLETQITRLLKDAKESGRSRLRIIYDAHASLSLKLETYSREAAKRHGFQIEPDGQKKGAKGAESATLWLVPLPERAAGPALRQGELMLVPAIFYVPERAQMLVGERGKVRWRIAYPYVPRSRESQRWRKPVDVWVGGACEFLARLGAGSMAPSFPSDVPLQWERDLSLPAQAGHEELAGQVFLADETYVH